MLYMDINCTRILKIEYCRMNTTCKSKKDDVLPDPAEHQPFFRAFSELSAPCFSVSSSVSIV
ncbi:MAG TPA: hypothetical protein DCP64_08335 [Sarcina sp.]|nr:hypothetical protein [Sarcina sp.]